MDCLVVVRLAADHPVVNRPVEDCLVADCLAEDCSAVDCSAVDRSAVAVSSRSNRLDSVDLALDSDCHLFHLGKQKN